MASVRTWNYLRTHVAERDDDLSRALLERRAVHGTTVRHINSCSSLDSSSATGPSGSTPVVFTDLLNVMSNTPAYQLCSCISAYLYNASSTAGAALPMVFAELLVLDIDPSVPTLLDQASYLTAARLMHLCAPKFRPALHDDLLARADAMEPTVTRHLDEHGPDLLGLLLAAGREVGAVGSLAEITSAYHRVLDAPRSTTAATIADAPRTVLLVDVQLSEWIDNFSVAAAAQRALDALFGRPDGSLLLPLTALAELGLTHGRVADVPVGASDAVLDTAVVLHRGGTPLDRALRVALDLES